MAHYRSILPGTRHRNRLKDRRMMEIARRSRGGRPPRQLPLVLGLKILASLGLIVTAGSSPLPAAGAGPAGNLEIRKGDHICLVGNTLAERMPHDGWLETYLQARFPRHELSIRNLGYSGDELTIRLRSADFGTPDQWLYRTKADVIFAFFGYNESFGDPNQFKRDLASFITHTLGQKYNGSSTPRVVLFSPLAHEDLKNRSLPDGKENNIRLERITTAMADVAKAHGVAFVDLFHATLNLYAGAARPYTINGIHLTTEGNRVLAAIIDRALFPEGPVFKRDSRAIDNLRETVLDKSSFWFNRYRTVDGYSIYGGRADLQFVDGQTNRVVMQREMEILDVMTANRDRRIWAVAQGGELKVDDGNTPPFIPVKTNKPGPGPHGEHVFQDGEAALKKMKIGKGLAINLFASEKEFPDLAKPVQMSFDAKGRLWVACWPTYPHWKPKEEMNDKILILEDTNGDGRADKQITFADHLHCPTGFEIVPQGVLVAQAPDLMLLEDTDGDDRADHRERVISGLDSADTHHTANSFRLDPGGALYFQEGTFHHSQVETPYGPPVRLANAGVFRYEPRSQKFEVYVTYSFANPHGHAFDRWGQDFVTDGTGNVNYYATAFSGHLDFPHKHTEMKPFFPQHTRPCPGTEILSSRHFPEDWQGDYLVANVIGFQGIHRYRVRDLDSGFTAEEQEPIVSSSDPNFRPSDIEVGPDGAIYFLEWQNPIIGHMQHNLRDPSRDRTHGRVYRVTYKDRPLLKPAQIAGAPIERLLDLLKEPGDRVRYRDKIELGARDTDEVLSRLKLWVATLDATDVEYEHHLLEALWVHQFHDAVNLELLGRVLGSRDFRARAAATRILCYWRDRVPDALERLKKLAADPYPRVRLEAVRAASFFKSAEAVEVPLITAEHPSDYYLDYTRGETMRALDPFVKQAMAQGHLPEITSAAGARFFLRKLDTGDLLQMKRTRFVLEEILFRKDAREEVRREAVAALSKLLGQSEAQALIAAIRDRDRPDDDPGESAVVELVRLLTDRRAAELAPARGDLERLATTARIPVLRQLAFASMITADGSADQAWALASHSGQLLEDILRAMTLIRDPGLRAGLYHRIEPLLHGVPAGLVSGPDGSKTMHQIQQAAMNALTLVRGQEAPTFRALVRSVRNNVDRPAAILALQKIPQAYWPVEEARPLLESLIGYLRSLPVQDRTTPEAQGALQLGDSLAALLPAGEARSIRKELAGLGIRVIRIGTVLEQMRYDIDQIVVQAGKPVQILFENGDMMPHNLVVTLPGALEEIGLLAEATATSPDAASRQYVPASPKILLASRLLQPRDAQKLSFTAPAQPGVYPFVCTYPGHWRRMYGAVYVVDDLEAYSASPETYLAAHVPEIADLLLKSTQPRREWTFDDLASSIAQLGDGRSYGNGKQLFELATCVSCHRMNSSGKEFGPDLTRLEPRQNPAELLRNILEPSAKINDKYYAYLFEMENGQVLTGLITEETPDLVRIVENPLASTEPRILRKSEISSRKQSPISIMPKGLLDKLSREEILDLISYIAAAGDPNHPLFQQEHGGHRH
jgi:putative heme-binding domain-containing protein